MSVYTHTHTHTVWGKKEDQWEEEVPKRVRGYKYEPST